MFKQLSQNILNNKISGFSYNTETKINYLFILYENKELLDYGI